MMKDNNRVPRALLPSVPAIESAANISDAERRLLEQLPRLRGPKRTTGQVMPHVSPEGQFARRLLKERRQRELFFERMLFGEPAWDMLLDLFAAQEEGRQISVSSLCLAAAVPCTTALRWVNILTQFGMLTRSPDPDDKRRVWLSLAPAAYLDMKALLRSWRSK